MSNQSSESYDIRLCHIIKWDDFDGYGFNLHAEKGKPGQYIGKVDEGSPAEAAGLKEGDRIVEVNGVNISNENHKQVVQRIKTTPNETKLLVVDNEADNYFRSNNIVIKSSLPNVKIFKTISRKETSIVTNGEADDVHSQISGRSGEIEFDNCGNIRLCHIMKWDDFDGYGFNLHAEKGRSGQYVGKVDDGSPAEAAGLKEGDRILEVNEVDISNENHRQVVQRIKSIPNETKLLVVDQQTEIYYKSKNIIINGSLPGVIYLKTPDRKKLTNGATVSTVDSYSRNSTNCETNLQDNTNVEKTSLKDSVSSTSSNGRVTNVESNSEPLQHSNGILDAQAVNSALTIADESQSVNAARDEDGGSKLNLNMTAKELRAKLAMKKKYDPKKDSLDFKKKYEIVQKL